MGCSYQVTTFEPSEECAETCRGCTFTHTVSGRPVGDDCLYTWTVTRTCLTGTPQTWQDHDLVPCGTTKTLTFFCDDDEQCRALEIVFTPGPCSQGPKGS